MEEELVLVFFLKDTLIHIQQIISWLFMRNKEIANFLGSKSLFGNEARYGIDPYKSYRVKVRSSLFPELSLSN